ncbi:11519_t:CDS:2, partial [Entrophospora sp. SA101]
MTYENNVSNHERKKAPDKEALITGGTRCFTRISCLILTEGESAKAFVLAGLEATNNKKWRVHSLQGKFLNVRDATVQQIAQNEEVQALDEGPQIGT